jgi:hypothetical protein
VREPNPALNALVFLARFFSPDQLNPLDLNPLRDILAAQLDFERIRADSTIKLFVAATRVATGESRIFSTSELTFIEALRKEGRGRAAAWLRKNFSLIGERSSFALAGI